MTTIKPSAIPLWSKGFISFARVERCKPLAIDDSAAWIGSGDRSASN